MKLLVDACAGRRLAGALRAAGQDVDFVGDWERDPGDDEILEAARARQRIVLPMNLVGRRCSAAPSLSIGAARQRRPTGLRFRGSRRELFQRILTRDKDFGTLAVRERKPHCGIVRLVELAPAVKLPLCLSVLTAHAQDLARSCLITVEAHRIRIREPEVT